MACRYRRKLATVLENAPLCRHPWEISVVSLARKGVSVIALDFDGVLAPHGDDLPLPEMSIWIDQCVRQFGAERVFILTNGPSRARMDYFDARFPGIRFVYGVRKKPYPDGLYEILRFTQVQPEALMLVDDRLLTGALAACLAGAQITYVASPYARISQRPVQEVCFMTLRGLERSMIRLVRKSQRLG
jgi:Predicted hydrolase of the HAD superfamily